MESGEESLLIKKTKGMEGEAFVLGGEGARKSYWKLSSKLFCFFAMVVFKIPKKVCKEIINVMEEFWWGDSKEEEKMHWVAWRQLCL